MITILLNCIDECVSGRRDLCHDFFETQFFVERRSMLCGVRNAMVTVKEAANRPRVMKISLFKEITELEIEEGPMLSLYYR